MPDLFETKRLIIKSPKDVSAEERLRYYLKNRSFFERYTPGRVDEYYTVESQEKALEAEIARGEKRLAVSYYYSLKEEPETIIGTVSFASIREDPYSSTVFGYDQDEDKQGMGYCTEACIASMKDFLGRVPLHRIEARVLPENEKSIHVLERLGFLPEGTEKESILIENEYRDHIRYALTGIDERTLKKL